MNYTIRFAGAVLVSMMAALGPAHATGDFLCEANDASVKFEAGSSFSHGLGEVFTNFKGTLKVLLKDTPKDFADLAFDKDHLAHHWFRGDSLKLHLYRERPGSGLHGYVELVVETTQSPDDETAFGGSYKLTVYHIRDEASSEGETLSAEGEISCSVG
jgi:hypothetical protein